MNALRRTWPLRLTAVNLNGSSVTSIRVEITAELLVGGVCLYTGTIGVSINNGATIANLLAGAFNGGGLCGTATTNPIDYLLTSAVTFR